MFTIDEIDFHTCPTGAVDRDLTEEAFNIYTYFKTGFLPYTGGIYDQPERLMGMIDIIESVRSEGKEDDGCQG